MNFKRISQLAAFLLLVNSHFAQRTDSAFNYAIKVYNLASYEEATETELFDVPSQTSVVLTTKSYQFLHPTFAFSTKTKKDNFHEIELIMFSSKQTMENLKVVDNFGNEQFSTNSNVQATSIAFRYEYIQCFGRFKYEKVIPALGYAFSPSYTRTKSNSLIGSLFPFSSTMFRADLFLIPRLACNVSERIFLDLNIPICVVDFRTTINKQTNPAIPVDNQTVTTSRIDVFAPIISVRMGVGFKF